MNYYEARPLLGENDQPSGWHYTCLNDNYVWAVGYCSRFMEAKTLEEGGFYTKESADRHNSLKNKYHGPSTHSTKEEACDCYIEYLLDNLKFFHTKDRTSEGNTKHKCTFSGCNSFETGYASTVGSQHWILCDDHNNRECIEQEFLKKGGVFSSFGS